MPEDKNKVPVIQEAIRAFREVAASDEFKELERLRSRARHNEASALRHARNEERIAIARNALSEKLPAETIARITSLSVSEVEQLARDV